MNAFWGKILKPVTVFFNWAAANHPGKLTGTLIGFGLGLLTVTLGFWRTLVLALFVGVGFFIGKRQDDQKSLLAWMERFFER